MTAFRWFAIVTALASIGFVEPTAYAQNSGAAGAAEIGFIERTNYAQDSAAAGVAVAENTGGAPANPVPAVAPSAPDTQASNNCQAVCTPCCDMARWLVFGEYLLLRPRNEGVEYAVPINGNIVANQVPLQVGPTAVVNPQFQSGFRVGFERILSECGSISLTYTYYRNDAYDGPANAATPFVLRSMVFNPSSADAATDYSSASAHESTSFNLVDLDYHHNLWSCDCSSLNYLIGTRYAQLAQQFDSDFESIISAAANAGIEFDGVGLRFGLDGEQRIGCGFFFTAMANANFLGGEFSGNYMQSNTNTPVVATTNWDEARFVTILEAGVTFGWESCNGHFRASVGYTVSDWLNVVKPSDFITAVQANQFTGPNQIGNTSLVFDGATARAELTW